MRRHVVEQRDASERPARAAEPAPPRPASAIRALSPDAVLALQRTAGNRAVGRALARAPADRTLARAESLVQQGVLGIVGGGVTLSASAYLKQGVAVRNSVQGVPEKDRNGRNVGVHLGPCDALRHCTWSALVMMAALKEDSPQSGLLDAVSNIVTPRAPAPSEIVSVSPASGTHLFPAARERTRAILMSHEIAGSGTKSADSAMDQSNNETGMSLAESLWKQGKRDDDSVCQAARAALENGDLKMFDIDGNLISTAGWRELNPETWDSGVYLDVFAKPTATQPRPRTRADRDKPAAPPAP